MTRNYIRDKICEMPVEIKFRDSGWKGIRRREQWAWWLTDKTNQNAWTWRELSEGKFKFPDGGDLANRAGKRTTDAPRRAGVATRRTRTHRQCAPPLPLSRTWNHPMARRGKCAGKSRVADDEFNLGRKGKPNTRSIDLQPRERGSRQLPEESATVMAEKKEAIRVSPREADSAVCWTLVWGWEDIKRPRTGQSSFQKRIGDPDR